MNMIHFNDHSHMDLSHGQVKAKTTKLVFIASPLSMQH